MLQTEEIFVPNALVIVESPEKSKKIQKLLGSDYIVKASVGHIRDLPKKDLGVDENTLKPSYVISDNKTQVVDGLRRAAKQCNEVILATDPDREGEAIAWHLKQALRLPDDVKRVSYQEVTESAVRAALASATHIDLNLVAAQEARRVLDRLIGYKISPALSQRAGLSLSAGRVQSVAVRFVVERDREIENFKPRAYQSLTLRISGQPEIKATPNLKPFIAEGQRLWSASDASRFVGPQRVQLSRIVQKPKTVNPNPPFTTVALQSAAGKVFGLSSQQTMTAAQGLFDQGHITYHRTDFPNLSDEGIQKIQAFLTEQGMPVAETVAKFKSKGDAQEAHEAIRPTDISVEVAGQTDSEKRLYSLIRERAMLSVMPPGVDATTEFVFVSERKLTSLQGVDVSPTYHQKGKVITEPGWRNYAKIEPVTLKDVTLPNLTKGSIFDGSVGSKEEFTKPPSRYTEHTLIRALESAGIGRPSTYHSILENIKNRQYVIPDAASKDSSPLLRSGPHGQYVVDALREMAFMDKKYTKAVESSLDKIARGQMGYVNLVRPVLEQINDDVAHRLSGDTLAKTDTCPGCGQPVIQKTSRNRSGTFWVHRDESHAENCSKYLDDVGGAPVVPPPVVADHCPNCKKTVVRRVKGGNAFWTHENKSDAKPCGHTFLDDEDGRPKLKPQLEEGTCPACSSVVQRRYSQKTHRHFWTHKAKSSKCKHRFLDDNDGVPALQE